MKKIILLLSVAVLGFSCSGDDDSSSSISDADVLGAWVLVSETEAGEEVELDECELMTTVTFTDTDFIEDQYSSTTDVFVDDSTDLVEVCESRRSTFPYKLEGNDLISTDFGEDGFEGELSVSGDQLTFDDEDSYEGEVSGSVRVFERVSE